MLVEVTFSFKKEWKKKISFVHGCVRVCVCITSYTS